MVCFIVDAHDIGAVEEDCFLLQVNALGGEFRYGGGAGLGAYLVYLQVGLVEDAADIQTLGRHKKHHSTCQRLWHGSGGG